MLTGPCPVTVPLFYPQVKCSFREKRAIILAKNPHLLEKNRSRLEKISLQLEIK